MNFKEERPALPGLTNLSPELARTKFHALLLANPNYFGNLVDSPFNGVLSIVSDTAWESIGCVGYNPQFEQLRATINIKLDSGYSGGICTNGSDEYVRFYLSYNGGATWIDQGMAAVNVFDVPGPKPLEYAVTLNISPKELFCFEQNLPLARAILSWNSPPPANTPGWKPVWGDVVDAQIQIGGLHIIPLPVFLDGANLKLSDEMKQAIDMGQTIDAAKPKALSPADLHALYAGTSVPQHRYLAPALAAAVNAPAPALSATFFGGLAGVDVSGLVGSWLNTSGDTAFEQLDCIGLDPNTSSLTGVLTIKQGSGYSGAPCTAGSTEYVAFWMDFGAGFQYMGTTSVVVHDFSSIPASGLEYNVFLPVNLLPYAQPCAEGPKTATVRAVLSWSTPPSASNPFAPVEWGNAVDGLILIPPGQVVTAGNPAPFLASVGAVDVIDIGSDGRIINATINALTGLAFGPYVDAPFGGEISMAGVIVNGSIGSQYRIMKAVHGSGNFTPIFSPTLSLTLSIITVVGGIPTESEISVAQTTDGYYPYQNAGNQTVIGNVLGNWSTGAADTGNAYDVRVDLSVDGNPAHDIQSNVVTVLVNNQAPGASLTPSFGECGQLSPGGTINGVFTATATDFGGFGFQILPSGPANGVLPSPASGTSVKLGGTIADPGVTDLAFTLDTTGMEVCGYSLTLYVSDRTNVDNGLTSNTNSASVGFCLQVGD